jgi:hypothetical protein
MPSKGYHCENGDDELHIEKNLSFACACGQTHNSTEACAHIMFPIENKTLYSCPQNRFLFLLVRPTGIFKIKGLKTVATYRAKDENEFNQILLDVESRKRTN